MLSNRVSSTGDLMSIALQAEREAIRRYTQLASTMHAGHNHSAAALFERMVHEEKEHERLLLEWMAQEKIEANSNLGPISWHDPQVSSIYDAEARDPYYSSPYRALAFAVHNEEIAFRFYTHVAADSDNAAVRHYAEILAREELGHAALLRAERRHAYHAENKAVIAEPRLDPRVIQHEADLLATAIHIDQQLANEIDRLATDSAQLVVLVTKTRRGIIAHKNSLDASNGPSEAVQQYLQLRDAYHTQLAQANNSPEACIQQLCACADRSFSLYDAVVATASDETVMLTAQKLANAALDRISVLKQEYKNAYLASDLDDQPGRTRQ